MGKVVSLLILSAILVGCAGMQSATEQEMNHEHIVQYDGMTKAQIYDKLVEWAALAFKDSKEVVQLADKEKGKIILKAIIPNAYTFALTNPVDIHFTMTIDIKDGRVRYDYSQIAPYKGLQHQAGLADSKQLHEEAELNFLRFEEEIKLKMAEKDSDW